MEYKSSKQVGTKERPPVVDRQRRASQLSLVKASQSAISATGVDNMIYQRDF